MADHKAILSEIKRIEPLWDNWYIKEEIGSGASSVVYRIEAKRENRTDVSALKVEPVTLDDTLISDKNKREALLEKKRQEAVSETGIMYSLKKSPYIVGYEDENIVTLEHTEGYVLLIRMEYLNCLQTLVKNGRFTPDEKTVLKLAYEIGSGLNAAHVQGIIHRDVKPANFFVTDDGNFKLGDFNISKTSASARSFAGTEGYIAPEIYKAKSSVDHCYTKQADIYSFGICLYQLMNDYCFPFEENCLADEAIDRRMNGEVLPMPKNASREFGRVILRACAYKIEDRYGSMEEMLDDIQTVMAVNRGAAAASLSSAALHDSGRNPFSQRISQQTSAISSVDKTAAEAKPIAENTPGGGTVYADSNDIIPQRIEAPAAAFKKKSGIPSWVLVLIMLLLIAAIGAGVFFLVNSMNKDKDDNLYPDDAVEFNGHHYMYFGEELTWRHAEEFCVEQGGHLVSLNSKEERVFVEELTQDEEADFIRVGGYRVADDMDKWYWTDDSGFTYTHWDSWKLSDGTVIEQPADKTGREYYMCYSNKDIESGDNSLSKGFWISTPNSGGAMGMTTGFVCEWE